MKFLGTLFLNRRLEQSELGEVTAVYGERGFTGCDGVIDCTKLYWKNCPLQLKGKCQDTKEEKWASIVAEEW